MVEQGRLAGIISIGDVVKQRVEEIERESEALRDYIRRRKPASSLRAGDRPGCEQRGDRLADRVERFFGGLGADRRSPRRRGGNRTSRCAPSRGLIRTSGGSPASRARVMRSCMMLNARPSRSECPGRPRRAEELASQRALAAEHPRAGRCLRRLDGGSSLSSAP